MEPRPGAHCFSCAPADDLSNPMLRVGGLPYGPRPRRYVGRPVESGRICHLAFLHRLWIVGHHRHGAGAFLPFDRLADREVMGAARLLLSPSTIISSCCGGAFQVLRFVDRALDSVVCSMDVV